MHISKIILGLFGIETLLTNAFSAGNVRNRVEVPHKGNLSLAGNYIGLISKLGEYPALNLENNSNFNFSSIKKSDPTKKIRREIYSDLISLPSHPEMDSTLLEITKRVDEIEKKIDGINDTDLFSIKQELFMKLSDLLQWVDILGKVPTEEQSKNITIIINKLKKISYRFGSILPDLQMDSNYVATKLSFRKKINLTECEKQQKESLILDCVAAIHDGQLNTAISKFNRILNFDWNWQRSEVERIIQGAYSGSLTNFDNLYSFIRNGIRYEQQFLAYETLMKEMKLHQHLYTPEIIRFAFAIKDDLRTRNNDEMNAEHRKILSDLISSLPECVRNLSEGVVCLKNNIHNEYLFADSDKFRDRDRRQVFTWRSGPKSKPKSDVWRFIPENDAKRFVILNNFFNKYIYAAANNYNYDKDRRSVYTWEPGGTLTSGRWVVEPQDESTVKIKLSHDNSINNTEYLYAAIDSFAYDAHRRRVFTWRTGGADNDSYWVVVKCNLTRQRRSLYNESANNANSLFIVDNVKNIGNGSHANIRFNQRDNNTNDNKKELAVSSLVRNNTIFFELSRLKSFSSNLSNIKNTQWMRPGKH